MAQDCCIDIHSITTATQCLNPFVRVADVPIRRRLRSAATDQTAESILGDTGYYVFLIY